MSVDWRYDDKWSRRFIPEMKRIMAQVLITEAPYEEDAQRNTDLIVLRGADQTRVACRVRRHEYYHKYHEEFTIRAMRHSGNETELVKVIKGWGRYLLYGFSDPTEQRLHAWILGDLNVFRVWYHDYIKTHSGQEPGALTSNTDGSSDFRPFKLTDLPPEFVISQHVPPTPPMQVPSTHRTSTAHYALLGKVMARRMSDAALRQWLGRWLRTVPLHKRTITMLTDDQAQEALVLLEHGVPA